MAVMKMRKMKSAMKIRGAKWQVATGSRKKTESGLTSSQIAYSKSAGKYVSKKKASIGKKLFNKYGKGWQAACKKARVALGITRKFVPCGGRSAAGKRFYQKAKTIYRAM